MYVSLLSKDFHLKHMWKWLSSRCFFFKGMLERGKILSMSKKFLKSTKLCNSFTKGVFSLFRTGLLLIIISTGKQYGGQFFYKTFWSPYPSVGLTDGKQICFSLMEGVGLWLWLGTQSFVLQISKMELSLGKWNCQQKAEDSSSWLCCWQPAYCKSQQ